jgi:ABC-2 type transport system ATP-binding protein
MFYAGIYGVPRRHRQERIGEILERTGLGERRHQIAGTLSGGWKQRVALASATIHEPPLLFLDEPTAGVDPVSRRDFWDQIHRISSEGTTVLLTTHYMDEAERCHRLAFIFRGQLLDTGAPEQIVERRGLSVVEFEVREATVAADILRARSEVDEVAHYGRVLRVAVRSSEAEAESVVFDALGSAGLSPTRLRAVRTTVEDAFVSMVREDMKAAAAEARAA